MMDSIYQMTDGVADLALSLLLQVTLLLAMVLMLVANMRWRRPLRHALCLGAVVLCAGCPVWLWQVRRSQLVWCSIPGPSIGLESAHESEPRSEVAAIDMDRRILAPSIADDPISDSASISDVADTDRSSSLTNKLVESFDTEPISESAEPRFDEDGIGSATRVAVPRYLPKSTAYDYRRTVGSLVLLWGLVIPVLAIRSAVRYLRVRRLLRDTEFVQTESSTCLLREIAKESGLRRCPPIVTSDRIQVPFVFGIFAPRIAVPRYLTEEQHLDLLRDVLAHEMCHIQRGDLWAILLQRSVQVAYWINPLVHILSNRMTRLREEICDNHVLKFSTAAHYSQTLLAITEHVKGFDATPVPLSVIDRGWSLEHRVKDLLSSSRSTDTTLSRSGWLAVAVVLAASALLVAGIGFTNSGSAQDNAVDAGGDHDPGTLLQKVFDRAEWWTGKRPESLKSLRYDYSLVNRTQPVELLNGVTRVGDASWYGTTLYSGIHWLKANSDRFDVTIEAPSDPSEAKVIRFICTPRNPDEHVRISYGNGISGTWRGYFSRGVRQVMLDVDRERLVPLREQLDATTTVIYDDWKKADDEHWVPGLVSVRQANLRWDMHFDWIGDAAWLLRRTDVVGNNGTSVVARTGNVKVNDVSVTGQLTEQEDLRLAAQAPVREMLEHNIRWLRPDLSGLDSIQYTFHALREDIKETVYLSKDRTAIVEVTHDGQNKLEGLGKRQLALPTGDWATGHRDDKYLAIKSPSPKSRDVPYARQLSNYARLGCQLDLPLFRFTEALTGGTFQRTSGDWKGTACDVIQVRNLDRNAYFGSGTMLAFSSWSYVHHIRPVNDTIYIDRGRHVPLHETIRGSGDRIFEIDYGRWHEIAEGQWVPLEMRVECKDYFTCEYEFQIVENNHWMLKELTSWFKPENKSRAIITDVSVNAPSQLHDDATEQLRATQDLFSQAPTASQQVTIGAVPLRFGHWVDIGDWRAMLTLKNTLTLEVRLETDQRPDGSTVPVLLFDKNNKPLTFSDVEMSRSENVWRGVMGLNLPDADTISSIALGNEPGIQQLPLQIVPIKVDGRQATKFADVSTGKTRVANVRLESTEDRSTTATLTVVSVNGPQAFPVTIGVALLDAKGQLLACQRATESFRVESNPVTKELAVSFGELQEPDRVASITVAIFNGPATSMPMGSSWGRFVGFRDIEIPLASLFAAEDQGCHAIAIQRLKGRLADRVLDKEFFEDGYDRHRLIRDKGTSKDILHSHAPQIDSIIKRTNSEKLRRDAVRLLGYAGDNSSVTSVLPLLRSEDDDTRDTAAIALAMLGSDQGFARLSEHLKRSGSSTDAIIALLMLHTDESIDLLGSTLMADLETLTVRVSDKGREYIDGRSQRAFRITKLLSYADQRSAPWVLRAAEYLDAHPEIAAHFDQSGLVDAMLRHEQQCGEWVARTIRQLDATTMGQIKEHRSPRYIAAVRDMMLHDDVTPWLYRNGVGYLWNVGTPQAVEVLREVYQQPGPDVRARLELCECLAEFGDDRGLLEALDAMADTFADPPTKVLDKQRGYAEDVFERCSSELVVKALESKLPTDDVKLRRAILFVATPLDELPPRVLKSAEEWASDQDSAVREAAVKLLERHGEIGNR